LEAIDYDLLTLGLELRDLGTPDLPWRRLRAVLTYLPSTSALARSMHGEKALWSTSEHLLAATVDALSAGNWQRGGGKGKKPKPVPRPGTEDESQTRRMGTARIPLEDAQAFFDRVNRA
jgi:hypothetical protein